MQLIKEVILFSGRFFLLLYLKINVNLGYESTESSSRTNSYAAATVGAK